MVAVGLVERDGEVGRIATALGRAADGQGGVLVIAGQAGIGKTALLRHACEEARAAGLVVLDAQAAALESTFAFGVVRQLFEGPLHRADAGERAALLAGAAGLARPVVAPDAASAPAVGDRGAMLHGLYWLAANLAERAPLLVAVDDAHWADAASLAYLAYLARRVEDLPVVLAVAVRTGDPPVDVAALAELVAAGGSAVEPAVLSARGVAAVVQARLAAPPDPALTAACHAASGGVPFLLLELLVALDADGIAPTADAIAAVESAGLATVAAALAARLARHPPAVTSVAHAAAVLGAQARTDRLAALAELGLGEAEAALDTLLAMGVLVPGAPVRFAHPLVQQAVHDQMAPVTRAAAHGRAAALLARTSAPVEEVAAHLLVSDPLGDPEVVARLREAAAAALAAGAPQSSVAYLQRALAEGTNADRAELLAALGRAEVVGQDPGALAHLQEASQLTTEPVARARLLFELAEIVLLGGHWDQRLALLSEALATLGDRDRDLQARIQAAWSSSALYDPRFAGQFEDRLPALRALVDAGEPGSRALALVVACLAALRGRDRADVVDLVGRGLDGGGLLRDEGPANLALPHAVGALVALDEIGALEQGLTGVLEEAGRLGSVAGTVAGSVYRMAVAAQCGSLRSAEADLRNAFELSLRHGLTFALTGIVTFGVDVLLERPELDDLAVIVEGLELDGAFAATASGAWVLLARGRLAVLRGDLDRARQALRKAGEICESIAMTSPILALWRSPLASILPAEHSREARQLVAEELRLAEEAGLARSRAVALRVAGGLEGGTGGVALLEESLAWLDGCDAPLERARSLVELGTLLRRAHRRAAAQERLVAGLDVAERCGAERLAARAQRELHALGARPRRRAVSGVAALTASELRVAGLAAEGLSNPQIAQALFVSRKTVENQLGATYRKLGVHAREELAAPLRGG